MAFEFVFGVFSAVLIVLSGLVLLNYYHQAKIGSERRKQPLTLFASFGIMALALSEIVSFALPKTGLEAGTLKFLAFIFFSLGLFLHFKIYAGRFMFGNQNSQEGRKSDSNNNATKTKQQRK